MKNSRFIFSFILILFAWLTNRPAAAAGSEPVPTFQPLTAANVTAVVDDFVTANMDAAHVPGVTIVVVHNGQVLLAEGYGYADLATGRAMTAATPVRAGSVSKPVTALAVLQLAAQGRIDLDAPISDYLTDLPSADDLGPAPTVAQLLALQGGYPDTVVQVHAPTLADWQPLGDYLAANLPPRVLPAGTAYSYTSWEHGLLGQMLVEVTGLPFPEAVADLVLTPLALTNSTFAQPLPPALADTLATGYAFNGADYDIVPHDYVNLSPGIALVTTAADMGDLLLTLLDETDTRLAPSTRVGALNPQLVPQPGMRGRSFAFSELYIDNRAVLYHDGNGIGFNNRILVDPVHDFGLFISVNHRTLAGDAAPTPANSFMRELSGQLVRTFLPDGAAPVAAVPLTGIDSTAYAGHYQLAGQLTDDFFRLGALLDSFDVRANDDGSLAVGSGRYVPVAPDLFQRADDPSRQIFFIKDEAGQVDYLTFGGTGTYRRAPWHETMTFQLGVLVALLLAFVPMTVIWPWRRRGPALTWLVSSLNLAFLAGFIWLMLGMDLMVFFKEIPAGTRLLLTYPWLAALLTAPLLWGVARLWRTDAGRWTRWGHTIVAVGSLLFLWFIYTWRLFL